jgi:hypothetical protein
LSPNVDSSALSAVRRERIDRYGSLPTSQSTFLLFLCILLLLLRFHHHHRFLSLLLLLILLLLLLLLFQGAVDPRASRTAAEERKNELWLVDDRSKSGSWTKEKHTRGVTAEADC